MRRTAVALLLGLAFVVTSVVVAQDGGAPKDGDKAAEKPRARTARLVKPWSELTTLTSDQRDQIMKIHADAVDRINEIREKEEADIMALLTPEQHKELDALKEKQKADQKAKRLASKETKDDKSGDGEPKDK